MGGLVDMKVLRLVLFVTSIICLAMGTCPCSYGLKRGQIRVIIRNNMGDGSNIVARCKGMEDFGVHVIKDGGTYDFVFGYDLLDEIRCRCESNKGWVTWEAYAVYYSKCSVCEWIAYTDGIKGPGKTRKWNLP